MGKWIQRVLLAGLAPWLATLLLLGITVAAVRIGGDPLPYPRPSSLFFPSSPLPPEPPQPVPPKPTPPPAPKPPPEPPLTEYLAEGPVDQDVRQPQIKSLVPDSPDPSLQLVEAKTKADRQESRTKARHLAIVFAFDDSGSMMRNDAQNQRYRVVLGLLAKLGRNDRVLLTRTQEAPIFATGWLSPAQAADVLRTLLGAHPKMDVAMGLPDQHVFPQKGTDLVPAIEGILGEVDPKGYKRSLLFLGDGDASNFGYRQGGTIDLLKRESITMSGVIFGGDAKQALDPSGASHFLVDDAKATGGEVKGADKADEIQALMSGLLEKSKLSVSVTYTLRTTFKSRAAYRKGDAIQVRTPTGSYTLKVR